MLAKSAKPHVRRLTAITTTIRTAITHWFHHSALSSTELTLHHELHQAARFWPVEAAGHDGEDTLPALEMGGILVFVYFDSNAAESQVSIDLDTVDPRLVTHVAGQPAPAEQHPEWFRYPLWWYNSWPSDHACVLTTYQIRPKETIAEN
ncbi:hypothetical protein ACWDCO_17320 [Streptomyces albogriseolus]